MEERLQKLLSKYGVASRRQAEQMIADGRVRVNGNTAKLGDTANDAEDVIQVDGVCLKKMPPKRYLMLNKPRGYETTLHSEKGRKNVADLIANCPERVYPVGRLDLNSEGLLLLTNDGAFANAMMHPKKQHEKVYHVWLSGYTRDSLPKLRSSIEIEGRMTVPAKVRLLSQNANTAMVEFVLHEGRNRQIRRLCEFAGVAVTRLKRIRQAGLELGDLQVGAWRDLTEDELNRLGIVK